MHVCVYVSDLDRGHGGMLFAEDLFVREEDAALVPCTLEVVVGRTVTAATANSGPWIPA